MNYVLKVAYHGSSFAGYQRQPDQRTVQGVLETHLKEIFQEPIELSASGRTDRGVHAEAQIVQFRCESSRKLKGIVEALNGRLSPEIAILSASRLRDGDPFHPRFSALSRTYRYRILAGCRREQALLWSNNNWCIGKSLNREVLQSACEVYLGTHDFATFTSRAETPSTVRTVYSFEPILEASPWVGVQSWCLEITADGFLRKMVRLLVASVVEVGVGHVTPSTLVNKLQANDPGRAPHPAPAEALYFHSTQYENDPFTVSERVVEVYQARAYSGMRLKPG